MVGYPSFAMEGVMPTDSLDAEVRSLMPPTEFSRRGFLTTSLIAGFTLATGPVDAQSVITTDTSGLTAGEVKAPVPDGEIPAYRAMPAAGGPFPVVLVVQEIFGVHEHIKDICRRFAKLGYLAVAPELYARQGDVSQMTDINEIMTRVVAIPHRSCSTRIRLTASTPTTARAIARSRLRMAGSGCKSGSRSTVPPRRMLKTPPFTLRQAQGERGRYCNRWRFPVRAEPV